MQLQLHISMPADVSSAAQQLPEASQASLVLIRDTRAVPSSRCRRQPGRGGVHPGQLHQRRMQEQ